MTNTPSPALDDLSLRDLLTAIEPMVAAVEAADAALALAKRQHKQAVSDAHTARNLAMAKADTQRRKAEDAFQVATSDAAAAHQAVLDVAQRAIEAATASHADACATAEPLLRELRTRSERMTTAAARSA